MTMGVEQKSLPWSFLLECTGIMIQLQNGLECRLAQEFRLMSTGAEIELIFWRILETKKYFARLTSKWARDN